MELAKKQSKKWVDYSDDDSEEEQEEITEPKQPQINTRQPRQTREPRDNKPTSDRPRQPKKYSKQQQIQKLDQLKEKSTVWLWVTSFDHALLKRKIDEFKEVPQKHTHIIKTFPNRKRENTWDIQVAISSAENIIQTGFNTESKIRVEIALKNFPREFNNNDGRKPNFRNGGGGKYEKRSEGGRGGDRRNGGAYDKDKKKTVYVDKQTGEKPTNKVESKQKQIEEKQRHYSTQEAVKKGMELANFRNKPKVDDLPTEIVKTQSMPEERRQRKELKEPKLWAMKQKSTTQEPSEKDQKGQNDFKKKKYLQKDEPKESKQPKEKKQAKKPKYKLKNEKDMLSEDSNE